MKLYTSDSHCLSTVPETELQKERGFPWTWCQSASAKGGFQQDAWKMIAHQQASPAYWGWLACWKRPNCFVGTNYQHLGSSWQSRALVWSRVPINCKCLIHKLLWSVRRRRLESLVTDLLRLYYTTKWACTAVMKKASHCQCVASFMDWNKLSFPGWEKVTSPTWSRVKLAWCWASTKVALGKTSAKINTAANLAGI